MGEVMVRPLAVKPTALPAPNKPVRVGAKAGVIAPFEVRSAPVRAAADAGLLRLLGIADLPAGPQLLRMPADAPYDWAVLRVAEDPLYQRRQLDIPRPVRRKLGELDGRGVHFDELLIAHEVDKDGSSPAKLDATAVEKMLAPSPTTPQRRSTRTVQTVLKVTGMLAGGAAALATAPIALMARDPVIALMARDPVLIGALTFSGRIDPGTPSALFEVARW